MSFVDARRSSLESLAGSILAADGFGSFTWTRRTPTVPVTREGRCDFGADRSGRVALDVGAKIGL